MPETTPEEKQRKKLNRKYAYAIAALGFLICPFVPIAGVLLFGLALLIEVNNPHYH